jgi:hypothetical protein
MRTAKSLVFPLFLLVSCLIAAPLTVNGQGSPPTPVSGNLTVPANSIAPGECAFDVELSFAGKAGVIVLPGDRVIYTSPGTNVTLINLSDPSKSVTLNITGSLHVSTQNGNTVSVATGRNLQGDPVAGFVLAIGTFSYVFDARGNLVQPLIGHGQLIDVCKLIS